MALAKREPKRCTLYLSRVADETVCMSDRFLSRNTLFMIVVARTCAHVEWEEQGQKTRLAQDGPNMRQDTWPYKRE